MPLNIVQIQGRLALTDDSGTVLGVFTDGTDQRLMVQALLKAGHGLATEATLDLIGGGTGVSGDPVPTRSVQVAGVDPSGDLRTLELGSSGQLKVIPSTPAGDPIVSVVSSGNSTTAPLGISGEFVGTSEEVKDYATITVLVYSDQASAINGFIAEYSGDGTNWDDTDLYTIPAAKGKFFTFAPAGRYFRVRYINGTSAQTEFRLQVIYHYERTKPSSHRINDQIVDDDDAELVKAVISGKKADGVYTNVALDDEGRLLAVISTVGAGVPTGLLVGSLTLGGNTAGLNYRIEATTYNEQSSNAQRSLASANANDTSAGTGARKVRITYFTSAGAGPLTEIVTLNGTSPVATVATDICFIESLTVTEVGSLGANAGVITLYVNSSGGGGTIGTIGVGTIVAAVGDRQTLWAHHYVPAGKIASLATFVASISSSVGSAQGTFFLRSVPIGVANSIELQISEFLSQSGGAAVVRTLGIPIKVTGPARVTAYVIPTVSNTTSYASFDYLEEDA